MAMDARAVAKYYTVEDFFARTQRVSYRLSEDARTLAYLQPTYNGDTPARMNIHIQELKNGKLTGAVRQLTYEVARDISSFQWKNSEFILFQKDFEGDENFHIIAINTKDGSVNDLTPDNGVRAHIEDFLPDDPDHVLISHNQRNPQFFDVYKVNVRTGSTVLVAKNPGNIDSWKTDHEGKVRAAVTTDGLNKSLLYRDNEGQPFRTLLTTDYRTQVDPLFFSQDNQKIYARSNRKRDLLGLVLIDPKYPEREKHVFTPETVDLDSVIYSRKSGHPLLATYQTDQPQLHFFDLKIRSLMLNLRAHLPGYNFTIEDTDKEETTFIVSSYNDRTPGASYVYDVNTNTLEKLSDANPAISEADMAKVKPISYITRDGLTIHGYLALPVGREPKGLACIVNPHGGPWQRDNWGYNPEVQLLANRGFCVLQINFRGSTGFGRRFWEAGFGQWGLKMQNDVTDGAQWLVEQGIADPKRLGIYGTSYGGYAALAGVTFTPELYSAAVDYVGVSNLLSFMNAIPPYWAPYLAQMKTMIGDPHTDLVRLRATSPAFHVDRITAPLLIAQGANDPRVNKSESDQVVEALRKRGVHVEYMVKDNEGHGFQNAENQIEFYKAAQGFLIKHLKP
jgi:dipeptidyl aminopeptidase/acylaminoacyl peptidase